jgi:hypothetical protein
VRLDGRSRTDTRLFRAGGSAVRRAVFHTKHYTEASGMKTEIDYLKRVQFSAGVLAVILAAYTLLLIASRVFVHRLYTNAMPQDLLAFLDCVYRVHLGQIVHRDFSSILGPFNFLLPAAFMSHDVGIIRSVNYSDAVYVAVAFIIYLYLQFTRLDRLAGFFLGAWIPLALLARMNFGDPLELVTAAMQYNRRCDVFLLLLLLLFIPAREQNKTHLVIDGVLYGAISAFLFYTKITFGLVALGLAPIMLIRKRDNIVVIAVGAVAFLAIAAWVEFGYGVRFAWFNDVKMAAMSSASSSVGRDTHGRILHILRDNLPEIIGLLVIPALILLPLRRLTISLALFCAYVGAVSVLIVSYSAQSYVLTLPIAFVFVALDALEPDAAFAQPIEQIRARYWLLSGLASAILVIESYPLAVNIAMSTFRAVHSAPWDSTNEVLSQITTDHIGEVDDSKPYLLPRIEKMSKLDTFSFARAWRPKVYYDNLLMPEYADYLRSGMAAARKGCEDKARISTMDALNSFPMLLGWPTGGGMFYAAPGYLMSKKAHLPNEVMFRDINCVLEPKLPVQIGDRDALLDIYGPYLSQSFTQSFESDMWTVFRRRTQPLSSTKP